jgi:hypothetical protein
VKDGFFISGNRSSLSEFLITHYMKDIPRSRSAAAPLDIQASHDGDAAGSLVSPPSRRPSPRRALQEVCSCKLWELVVSVGAEKFIEGLGGLPLLIDNSWGLWGFKSVEKGCAQNAVPFHFNPFLLEDPKGMEYMRRGGEEGAKLPWPRRQPMEFEIWNEQPMIADARRLKALSCVACGKVPRNRGGERRLGIK